MARNNYKGYYLKVGNTPFNDPAPKRDTFKFAPELVQVGESQVLASGRLSTKVLPHTRRKIWFELPPMTQAQYKKYWDALHSDAGGDGMYLTVEVYDDANDTYITDTYYHTDLVVKPIYLGGQWMYVFDTFELIGH